jgi:outer membrane biogenesis lipoprotein LolB
VSLLSKQMKSIVLAIVALLVIGCASMVNTDHSNVLSAPEAQTKNQLAWQTPTYQGLRIGESNVGSSETGSLRPRATNLKKQPPSRSTR